MKDVTIRDRLAAERTSLANERTLLSYVRTMIAFIAIGGTLIKFFNEWYMLLAGIAIIFTGFIILALGMVRFVRLYYTINEMLGGEKGSERENWLGQAFWLALNRLHLTHKVE